MPVRIIHAAALASAAAIALPSIAAALPVVSTLGSTGSAPRDIVLDAAGNVYTTNFNSATVSRITQGGTSTVYASTDSNPYGMAIGADGGILTVSPYSITRITGPNQSAAFVSGFPTAQMTIGVASNGDVVVGGKNWAGPVRRFAADGTLLSTSAVSMSADDIVLDPAGNAYVASANTDKVWKIGPDGVAAGSPWPVAVTDAVGITRDSAGNLYASTDASVRKIHRITPDGTATLFATLPAGEDFFGITIDSAGNLYTANNVASPYKAYRITPAGQVSELATLTGQRPYALALDAAGALYSVNGSTQSNNVTKITDSSIAPALPAIPAAPQAVAGAKSAVVTITPNATSARYGTATSYTVTAVQSPVNTCTVTPPATACTVTGLDAGTTYTFTAHADLGASSIGPSSPSNPVTTDAAPVTASNASSPPPSPPSNAFTLASSRAMGGAVRTRVRVPGPGVITQRGTFRTGGATLEMFPFATRTACFTSATSTTGGTVAMTCRLTAAARRARLRTPLRVSLRTTFTPTGGTARSTYRTVLFGALRPRPVPAPRVTG